MAIAHGGNMSDPAIILAGVQVEIRNSRNIQGPGTPGPRPGLIAPTQNFSKPSAAADPTRSGPNADSRSHRHHNRTGDHPSRNRASPNQDPNHDATQRAT